jgi:DNA-binding transcriptional LysR family regulator
MADPHDLDLDSLAALLSVAKHGGIRAASRAIKIPQPTLSKRIARLEKLVGNALLDRSNPGQLTAEGRRVLALGERILSSVEAIVFGHGGIGQAAMRMGVACSASEDLAVRLVNSATQSGREIELSDGTSDILLRHLRSGRIDALLGRISLDELPKGLEGRVIATDRLGVLCPRGHALDRKRVHIRDLEDQPVIGFTPGLCSGLEQDIAESWSRSGARWKPIRRISGADAMMTLVQAGVGVVVIPERLAHARGGALRFIPFADRGAVSRIVLLWSSTMTRADRELLKTWLKSTRIHPA